MSPFISKKPLVIFSSFVIFVFVAVGSFLLISRYIPVNCQTPRYSYEPLSPSAGDTNFAIIGDYGDTTEDEQAVAELVYSWQPDFIVTVGDNAYIDDSDDSLDADIGQYYQSYIGNYVGAYGSGNTTNRFFPTLGNHDWLPDTAQPYLDYFTLPGNERYYDFVQGSIHFFVLDSDPSEPDGITVASKQAQWLQAGLAASTTPFQFVMLHHPPYSSGEHGSTLDLQWPFANWGADAVFAGHDHDYERLEVDGIPYFVNGVGGHSVRQFVGRLPYSQTQYSCGFGAMRVIADAHSATMQFTTVAGVVLDSYTIRTPVSTIAEQRESIIPPT